MTRTANRGFNHRQAMSEEWFRTRVLWVQLAALLRPVVMCF